MRSGQLKTGSHAHASTRYLTMMDRSFQTTRHPLPSNSRAPSGPSPPPPELKPYLKNGKHLVFPGMHFLPLVSTKMTRHMSYISLPIRFLCSTPPCYERPANPIDSHMKKQPQSRVKSRTVTPLAAPTHLLMATNARLLPHVVGILLGMQCPHTNSHIRSMPASLLTCAQYATRSLHLGCLHECM